MYYQVKDVSDMVGLSVRMLHHYDKIGLLKPDHVTSSGYRQYSEEDLGLLQQILFLRELDFPLNEIREILSSEAYDPIEMLDKQATLIQEKANRLLKIIDTIQLTKECYQRGENMSNKERFDGLNMSEIEAHIEKYADEVKEKWGNTKAYEQSKKRTSNYNKEDLKKIQDETNVIYNELVSLMKEDVSHKRVQELVSALRQGITDNFYDCDLDTFGGLGQMYVADPRFTKNLDKYGQGFAVYLSEAIAYYCTSQEESDN